MWYQGGNIVSINDFLREMCLCGDTKESLDPFIAKFCRLVHDQAAPHDFWYIAEILSWILITLSIPSMIQNSRLLFENLRFFF
jgi:hypothetical protein